MFIIFGWGHVRTTHLWNTAELTCPNCHNTTRWQVIKIQHWFTLFFLPIFPYSTKHYLKCPICDIGIVVSINSKTQSIMEISNG